MPSTVTTSDPARQVFPDPIPNIIPFGSICLFAGASGAGKTLMQTEWIARWQQGKSIWGHATNTPSEIYYVAADRDWSTYAQAFANAGAQPVPKLVLAEDETWPWAGWTRQSNDFRLTQIFERLKPIPNSLLFIEPFTPLFVAGDQNRANDVAIALHTLRRFARKYQLAAAICSANVGKAKNDGEAYVRPQDRIAGSGALVAFSDTQIYLFQGPTSQDPHTFGWTPRCAKAEEFTVRFNPETRLFEPDRMPAPLSRHEPKLTHTQRLEAFLLLLPYDTQISRADLEAVAMAQFDVSRATIARDLETLLIQGSLIQPKHGVFVRPSPS